MELIINGKRAALKKGSSFEYVSENRAFSDADDYTLSITLPLAGCPENLDIFGHLERMDCNARSIIMDASIIDHAFSKNGVITVVEASEKEMKCQFMEGRSAQNFNVVFDDIYINELPLGTYPSSGLPADVSYGDIDHGQTCVALPWINDASEGFLNNEVIFSEGKYQWADSTREIGKLSYMPYLITIAERVCQAVGYSYDFSDWRDSEDRLLLVCNVLPASWDIPQFSRALPHWSVSEFFSELENLLVCEFDIDHRGRHIGMSRIGNTAETKPAVRIDNVVDVFSSEVSYGDDICRYKGLANVRYADRGDEEWKYEQCQWLIDRVRQDGRFLKEFRTTQDYIEWSNAKFGASGLSDVEPDAARDDDVGSVFHIIDIDSYFLFTVKRATPISFRYSELYINRFGDIINDPDSDNEIVLQCVPARLGTPSFFWLPVLSPSAFCEVEEHDSAGIRQPKAYSLLLRGDSASSSEYYDKLYLAYWDGSSSANDLINSVFGSHCPSCPVTDYRLSLRHRYKSYAEGVTVNPREKLKISFLSASIPDVGSVFFIRGKRYLCEKITATFTEDGMSQLMKGEFFMIND